MKATQHFVPGTNVRYKTSNLRKDDKDDSSKVTLNCVFRAFKSCIERFNITSGLCK